MTMPNTGYAPWVLRGLDGISVSQTGLYVTIGLGIDSGAVTTPGTINTYLVQRYTIPEDTSQELQVNLILRLLEDAATSTAGATSAYTRVVTVRREGAAAPVIVGATDLITHEEVNGTWAADTSMPAFILDGNDLLINFTVANNSYADGDGGGIIARSNVIVLVSVSSPPPVV